MAIPFAAAEAQNFWDTDPPRKTKKAKAKPKPSISEAASRAAEDARKKEAGEKAAGAATGAGAPAPASNVSSEVEAAREAARQAKDAARAAKDAVAALNAAPAAPGEIIVPTAARPDAGPVVAAAFNWLTANAAATKAHKDDIVAAKVLYGERSGNGLWIGSEGFHGKGKAVIEEIAKAEDWGLDPKAFDLPQLAPGAATPEALGEAEAKLTLAALKYVRHARGGRVHPQSLSRIWDQEPPLRNPIDVVNALAQREEADSYLRAQHPQHEQFKRLRAALLKARGPAVPEPVDPALQIKLPKGPNVKPGAEHADIALLRQRLKMPAAAGAKETLLDPLLIEAVQAFQKEKGLEASGGLTQATRTALNSEGEARKPNPTRDTQRILINMERWRWMPEDMGAFHVWDNVPEFAVRVVRNGEQIYKEKIIVGQPTWPTPVFSADMLYVMFYPSWGMPDGIKRKELLPRIQAGGGGFFGLFGGGSSVIEAYDLKVYHNGRQIEPGSVNWSTANISNYSFIQPPGPKNPLGVVKFRFPNKHDVYMHDTPERELFARGSRALSHGCIRVNNPMRFAEILIEHDRGPGARAGGGDVTLKTPIPVHITYFTAIADENGRVTTFGDIYGHDSRISSALGGRSLPYEPPPPEPDAEAAVASSDDGAAAAGQNRKRKKKGDESVQDIINSVFLN